MSRISDVLREQIAELEAAEKQAERSAAFEHLLGRMAGDLMTIPAENAEEGLIRAIEPIVRFIKMDLGALCIFNFDTQKVSLRAHWRADSVGVTQGLLDGLPMNEYPFIVEKLMALELFIVEDTARLSGDQRRLGHLMHQLGARSMVLIPMSISNEAIGFLALASIAPRSINLKEFISLKTTGQLIAIVLQRLDRDQRLKERETELEATLSASGDGLLVIDISEKVILANKRLAELFHLKTIPAKGVSLDTIINAVAGLLPDKSAALDLRPKSEYDVSTPFEDTWSLTDGRYVEARRYPFRRESEIVGQVWTFRDITVERNLELQLQQSQKLESIGRLASGIAHDFNNILFSITSICDVRLNKRDATTRDRKNFGSIKEAAERAATLTRQLLAFSRRQVLSMTTISLNDVVDRMAEMLHRLIGENISLQLLLEAQDDVIRADPHQLEQVILNLVVNARDAMPTGGTMTLETHDLVIHDNTGKRQNMLSEGEYIKLRVTDTGFGMDQETVSRVFEPFFTTKQMGKGTGLGLAMIYGIIKQHGGHVAVNSTQGEGSTFDVYLPRISGDVPKSEVRVSKMPLERGMGETILLVEDEELPRKATSLMLTSQGYEVLQATNGEEALTLAEFYPIDILLTDVVMPKLGGPQLYEKLREKYPHLPVVFISGFIDDTDCIRELMNKGHPFLHKPVRTPILLSALRKVLAPL